MVDVLFVITTFLISFGYVFYPCLLWSITKIPSLILRKGKKKQLLKHNNCTPKVTIIVSVFNEASNISTKIWNFLTLNYPEEKLDLLFVSDGSEDGTDLIVKNTNHPRIHLIRQEPRKGKTSALNLAIPEAKGEILIFSDCNTIFDKNAVNYLVGSLKDPEIGLVSGRQIYIDKDKSPAALGFYGNLEAQLKRWESSLGVIAGADGAIYALRKNLYRKIPLKYINDFYHPISVIKQGHKAIYEHRALAMEEAGKLDGEMIRQTRMTNQAAFILWHEIPSLVIRGHMGTVLILLGHKIARWLICFWLLPLFILNLILLSKGWAYLAIFALQLLFYALAAMGYFFWSKKIELPGLMIPYAFLGAHLAMAKGIIKSLTGNVDVTWDIQRDVAGSTIEEK